ncbi:LysR family transcriptional regulator [Saccharothrix saharensis]|uniref:LysR family transcriptional regulator n=1 Tax=Saccharothrix saharensis TaxID=571190 RepID=UPI0036AF0617
MTAAGTPDHDAALLAELLDCPPHLLDLSLDQLRTLAVVRVTGSAQRAAKALGREQSSVQKQLDNLNATAVRLVGEALVLKQGRGKDHAFTPSGEEVVDLAIDQLRSWNDRLHHTRRRVGSTITVGTTEFTVQFLGSIWPGLRTEFERRGIQLKIEHVRTRDLWARLDAKQVDLVCGSLAAEHDQPVALDYDFIEWHRERVALLTNLTTRELPDTPVTSDTLRTLPLLVPSAGLLAQFLSRWYGPDYRGVLNVVADIDSLNYGLTLLDNELLHGAMLTTERVAHAAVTGKLPGTNLRNIPLAHDYKPDLQIVTGIFARPGERHRYAPDHPLNLLWTAFANAVPTQRT